MQSALVLVVHLVHLIYGGYALVRQNQGSRFDGPAAVAQLVLDSSGGEARRGGALARGVYAPGGDLGHIAQKLGLGYARIAHQEDVDVPPDACSVGKVLLEARDQLQAQGLLDIVIAVNGGGY